MIKFLLKDKRHTLLIIVLIIIFLALASPLIFKEEGKIFCKKLKNSYSNSEERFLTDNESKRNKDTKDNFVWAAYPPSVNLLPTCSFSDGRIGDVFVKNSGCSWSENKCTLTSFDECKAGVDYYGNPWGDYCWCNYDSSKVCAVQHTTDGVACWSWKDGNNYAEYCNFCVRR
jgi:hypothetical protein